jgi:hypothetical protein
LGSPFIVGSQLYILGSRFFTLKEQQRNQASNTTGKLFISHYFVIFVVSKKPLLTQLKWANYLH